MVSAQELSETNVRVKAIGPGLTETGMTKLTFDDANDRGVTHTLGRLKPLRRAAQPEETPPKKLANRVEIEPLLLQ